MKNNWFFILCKYVIYLIFFVLFGLAKLGGTINPFSFAFLFALIYLKQNEFAVGASFFVTYALLNFDVVSVVIALFGAVVAILFVVLHRILKKKISLISCFACLLASQTVYIRYNVANANLILQTICTVVLSILFCYACICALSAILTRGIYTKLAFDENVCLAIFISSLALGLLNVYVARMSLLSIVVVFGIMFLSFVFEDNKTIYFACACGIGACLANNSVVLLAVFVAYGTSCLLIKDAGKWASATCILISDFVIGEFLNAYATYSLFNILSVGIGCLFFCLIPKKFIERTRLFVGTEKNSYLDGVIQDYSRFKLKDNLQKNSQIFYCLSESYKELLSGEISKEQAKEAIKLDIENRVCGKCEKKAECEQFGYENLKKGFDELGLCSLEKQKVCVADVPPVLVSHCNKVNAILGVVQDDIDGYAKFGKTLKRENQNKLDMAEQFLQTAKMFQKICVSADENTKRNLRFEKQIVDELLFYDIIAKEVNVFENESGVCSVLLVVRTYSAKDERILVALKDVLKISLKRKGCVPAMFAGWSVLNFELAPKFDAVVGVSSVAKRMNVSGDTFGVFPLINDKLMTIICDGMGNGKEASNISRTTLDIIKNFYSAGYSSSFVMNNVNRILNLSNREIFSCVDLCVIDTLSGFADFVKMGSSVSVIKRKNSCVMVKPEALPIGIVEKIKVTTTRQLLNSGDIVVLASDGVVDSFSSPEQFSWYVNNLRIINPQTFADQILSQSINNSNGCTKDDMSVVVIRLISCA